MISTAALASLPPGLALAGEHTVEMLTRSATDPKLSNLFEPRLLVVQPGDTVLFAPTEKGHNSASIKGMIPEGAEAWNGRINQEVAVTFDKPGYYGYKCTPHLALGMVGLVVVEGDGKLDNLEAAKAVKQRGRAKQAFEAIWAEADTQGLTA